MVAALLAGYLAVWAATGLPVYAYSLFAEAAGSLATVLSALLLLVGGAYQFTALKRNCHARCSNPLLFLMQKWRPGTAGALRHAAGAIVEDTVMARGTGSSWRGTPRCGSGRAGATLSKATSTIAPKAFGLLSAGKGQDPTGSRPFFALDR
jgi:hypothetical protein